MQEAGSRKPSITRIAIGAVLIWSLTLGALLAWSISGEFHQCITLASTQTRSFFQEFLMTRFWNTLHGGVYVRVTEDTPPNPFLQDDPERDLVSTTGVQLTKLNPAYMTRQISEIAKKRSKIVFHLTGLDPINPANAPDAWEEDALRNATASKEKIMLTATPEGENVFRFFSPLAIEPMCMDCHRRYGDTLGSERGGISVAVPAQPLLDIRDRQIRTLTLSYLAIWLMGVLSIGICAMRMQKQEGERTAIIEELQRSLQEVKRLSGLLPICCACKNIRDDKGYWQEVERYMSEHADVRFTHGICPACSRKLYPELYVGSDPNPGQ